MINACKCIIFSVEWPKSKDQPSSSIVQEWILHYRGIYLLNNVCNLVFGTIVFPFTKMATILVFILCFFASFRLFKYLDFLSLVFVASTAVTTCLSLVPTTLVMSSLYDISRKFSENLFPRIRFAGEKKTEMILKGYLKSCPLTRCQVGSLYHMEAKAKLTVIHNVVNGIVFLLVNVKAQ